MRLGFIRLAECDADRTVLHFRGDGTGEGVLWELIPAEKSESAT